MTWDSSWKDITALDGLKRQPYKAVYHNDLVNAMCERYGIVNTDPDFNTIETLKQNKIGGGRSGTIGEIRGALPFSQNRCKGSLGKFDPFIYPPITGEYCNFYDDNIKNSPSDKTRNNFESTGGFGAVSLSSFKIYNSYTSNPSVPYDDLGTSMRHPIYSSHMIWFKQMLKFCINPCSAARFFTWTSGANFDISPLYINGNQVSIPHRCQIWREKTIDGILVPWVTVDENTTSFIDPYYGQEGYNTDYSNYTYQPPSSYNNTIGYYHLFVESAFGTPVFAAIMLIDNIAFEYV